MISNAIFHLVNAAGGLDLDPRPWNDHMTARAPAPHRRASKVADPQTLADAAEQLRRLGRYVDLPETSSKLLANALAIVERESTAKAYRLGLAQR